MTWLHHMNLADEAFQAEEFEDAAKNYTVVIHKTKDEFIADAYIKRCQCYYELQDYESALDDAGIYVANLPESVAGYLWKGKCLTKLNSFNDAYVEYRKGLEIEPQNAILADDLRCLQEAIMAVYQADETRTERTYDAVQICSQEPYPGDDELEELEREIIHKWKLHHPPNIEPVEENLDIAADELAEAIEAKEMDELDSALEHVNRSAVYNPGNQFMLEERADILFRLRDCKEAFRCCNSVPFSLRSVALWTLGGKILDVLHLPVMAETWLRIATQIAKSKQIDSEASVLFQKVRVKRLYEPMSINTKSRVAFTKHGRAVVSREHVKAGDVILSDVPVVCAQTIDSNKVPACANCAKCLLQPQNVFNEKHLSNNLLKKAIHKYWPNRKVIPCRMCTREIYCSIDCQEDAWNKYHCLICPEINKGMKKLYEVCDEHSNLKAGDSRVWSGWWNAAFSPLILTRIWASITCSARKLGRENGRALPSLNDWTLAKAPFRRFIAYGAKSNADYIPKMFDLMIEIFQDLGDGLGYTITKKEFDGRYYQATCNVQAFSDTQNPYKLFLKNIKGKPTVKNIIPTISQEIPEAEFAGLFPLHACINHSCANNADVLDGDVDGKPGVAVRARQSLEPGEEVYITYINTKLSRTDRRAWLFRAYNFWCYCERCKSEDEGPHICSHCRKQADVNKGFPTCSKCKKACYCSTGCQKVAWKKGHKKICGTVNTTSAGLPSTS